ncbi:MAG TPA: HAD-IC family P-type ATPase, partial [Ilumatobacteraceae bacterium]|nr:HAD-IC family P-type ATPase [Ilumatobacteraceae bacterium]
ITVAAVAERAGLADWKENVDARELPNATDDESAFADAVVKSAVFGRVSPQQKRAMVQALQSRGHTVAMTGDGVNDVLALKDADCGIAMASGSEATRGVAQLVLMDSNFAALPPVVAEGRRVINNIERVASLFLCKTTYSIMLSVLAGIFAFSYPLRPIHLTLMNFVNIGAPAFVMALEPNSDRVHRGFLLRVLHRAIPAGLVTGALALAVFQISQTDSAVSGDQASSIAVLTAGSIGLIYLIRVALPLNPVRLALVATMSVLFAVAFLVPFGRKTFALPVAPAWTYALAAGAIVLAIPLLALGARVKLPKRWENRLTA